jgi:hypothetical protein
MKTIKTYYIKLVQIFNKYKVAFQKCITSSVHLQNFAKEQINNQHAQIGPNGVGVRTWLLQAQHSGDSFSLSLSFSLIRLLLSKKELS